MYKKCIFHSPIPLKNWQIFKKIEKCEFFLFLSKMGNWPLLNVQRKISFTFSGHVLTLLAWTICRLVTKHEPSITHFPSCFFSYFSIKILFLFIVIRSFKSPNVNFQCRLQWWTHTFFMYFHLFRYGKVERRRKKIICSQSFETE